MYENKLKYIREKLDMTQKELGFLFNVDASTYRGWESGKTIIPLKHLIKFSNLYGYSLDYLLGLSKTNIKYKQIEQIDNKYIGKRLKILRRKLNLSQSIIAKECMINQTTYSNYEKGYYLIFTISLYTICKKHKVSMDFLLGRKTLQNKNYQEN